MPGTSSLTQQFKKAFENTLYHMAVIGNTNVGKSSLLNDLMGNHLLNTSERRETIFHWHIRYPLSESYINEDPNMYTLQTIKPELNPSEAGTSRGTMGRLDDMNINGIKKVPTTSLGMNKGLSDMKYRYNNLEDLIKVVSSHASSDILNKPEIQMIEKIKITLPNEKSLIVKDSDLNIVDLPGIENYIWSDKIQKYLEKHQDTIIPIFLIDLTQGTFDLTQFTYVKNIFRKSYGMKVPFVFSKFGNLLNDINAKIEFDGLQYDDGQQFCDLPSERQIEILLAEAQNVLNTFRS